MRKLNVYAWLIETVVGMYEFSNIAVRVNTTVDNKFSIKVGEHQGSVLNSSLFVMVAKVLYMACKSGLPREMLCAADLAIFAESLEQLEEIHLPQRNNKESKGLRINKMKTEKTKIIRSSTNERPAFASLQVANSILCGF